MDEKPLGQIAYEAYCAKTGGRSLVSGAALPGWYALSISIREAWMVAGHAVAAAVDHEERSVQIGVGNVQNCETCDKTRQKLDKARAAWDKAWEERNKERQEYNKAREEHPNH